MPKEVRNQLTHLKVQREKRAGRYADGNGLYLVVSEHGGRWWPWRGTVHGRRREIGMGSAYVVSLADARALASDWRALARAGADPQKERDKTRAKVSALSIEDAARQV